MPRLIVPSVDRREAFLEMANEWRDHGEDRYAAALADFDAFMARQERLADPAQTERGRVPQTSFWLADGDEIVACVRIRFALTPALEVEGGHIGYDVRPSCRGRGFGRAALDLGLREARRRGLERVLLTVDADNVPSIRIIEGAGGVRSGTAISAERGVAIVQYWLALDWIEQVDRFWADELGVARRLLRTNGLHVHERAEASDAGRVTIVGTSTATIVSLPRGGGVVLERGGIELAALSSSPRRVVASWAANDALVVRGPAYLGYLPLSSVLPTVGGRAVVLDQAQWLAALRERAPVEWDEAGFGEESCVFGVWSDAGVVAVAGYERWAEEIAQLQVFCAPECRRRGIAAEVLAGAIADARAQGLLPQFRTRDGNEASVGLAKRLGFVEYGWMATVRWAG